MNSQNRIKLLDSARGLAALIVVIHHIVTFNATKLKTILPSTYFELLNWLSNKNVEAVLFFFIISGFSIGLGIYKFPLVNKDNINFYLYKRFKRILPLYWLILCILIIILVLQPDLYNYSYSTINLLGNLLFLQTPKLEGAWFIPYGNNGPLWSLSYEFFFYLIAIPVLYFRFKNTNSLSRAVIVIVVSISISTLMIWINHHYPNPFSMFLSLFPIWLVGTEFSIIYLQKQFNYNLLIILLLLCLSLYVLNSTFLHSDTLQVLILGLSIALTGYIGYFITKNKYIQMFSKPIWDILNTLFYKIGIASFSIYLSHYILLNLLNKFQIGLPSQLAGITLLIIACYYFETWLVKQSFNFFRRKYV